MIFKRLVVLLAGGLLLLNGAAQAQKVKAVSTRYEHGTLTDKKPTGTWEYFDEAGQPELRMNYDSSQVAYRRPDTARYELRVGEEWRLGRPSRAPGVLGSRAGRHAALQKSLHYPIAVLQQQQQGDVLLSYIIGTDGHASGYTIESTFSPAAAEEVGRAAQAQPDQWIPAVYRGRPTAARFYLAVHFSMAQVRTPAEEQAAMANPLASPASASTPYVDHFNVTAIGIERRPGASQPGGIR